MKTKSKKFIFPILLLAFLLVQSETSHAYESGIHYYLTYILADVCGLADQSEMIALGDYSVDKFGETDAGSHFDEWLDPFKEITRRIYHFPVQKGDVVSKVIRGSQWAWETVSIADDEASPTNLNPIELGIGIHTLQDSYAHAGFTPLLGHWKQDPDLPKTDVPKLLEAAQSTWTALDSWSIKVYGHGCQTQFTDISDRIQVWAALDLNSDEEIHSAWNAIAETIAEKTINIDDAFNDRNFQTSFKAIAAHIHDLKK